MSTALLAALLDADGITGYVAEYRFHPTRRWRFDLAFPEHRLAVEIEGGVFTGGRHTRGAGYVGDLEKYNAATLLGWRLLRFTPAQVADGTALTTIRLALGSPPESAPAG